MARMLGDAFVAIFPDMSGFNTKLRSGAQAAVKGVNPQVDIGLNTKKAAAEFEAFKKALQESKFNDITLGVNTDAWSLSEEQITRGLMQISAMAEEIKVTADNHDALAKIYQIMAAATELEDEIKRGKADFNIDAAQSKLYSLYAQVQKLQAASSHIDADFDIDKALGKQLELREAFNALQEKASNIQIDPNDVPANAKLAALAVKIDTLAAQLRNMPIDANTTPFIAKLLSADAAVDALKAKLADVGDANEDILPKATTDQLAIADLAVQRLNADLAKMSNLHNTNLTGDMTSLAKSVDDAKNAAEQFNDHPIADAAEVQAVAELGARVAALKGAFDSADGALNTSIASGGVFRMMMNAMQVDIPLFGDAVGKTFDAVASAIGKPEAEMPAFLDHMTSMTKGWHLMLEAVVETAAVWGPALIASGVFVAAAVQGAKAIEGQYTNVKTVINATGDNINGLKGGMSAFEQSAVPALTSIEGAFVRITTQGAGPMDGAVREVGKVVQDFAAKITALATNGGGGFAKFVGDASKDIAGLGASFAALGHLLDLLLKDVPGYAQKLLTVGTAALQMSGDVVSALNPAIAVFMKFHGAFFYLGLAGTVVSKFGGAIGGMLTSKVTALGAGIEGMAGKIVNFSSKTGIAENASVSMGASLEKAGSKVKGLGTAMEGMPWGMIVMGAAAAGIGLFELFKYMNENDDAAKKLGNDFVAAMAQITTAGQANQIVLQDMSKAYKGYNSNLAEMNTLSHNNAVSAQDVEEHGRAAGAMYKESAGQLKEYTSDVITMMSAQTSFNLILDAGSKAFGSQTAFLTAWTNAGLKVGDLTSNNTKLLKQDTAQLLDYTMGLQANLQMNQKTGSSVAALTIAASAQVQAASQLNSAWQAFITTATGSDSAMVAFRQGLTTTTASAKTITTATKVTSSSLNALGLTSRDTSTILSRTSSGGKETSSSLKAMGLSAGTASNVMNLLNGKSKTTSNALNGTSAASLTLRNNWDQLVGQGSTVIQSLNTQAATAGNTAKAQKLLADGGKDVVAQLIPLAKGSKEAQAQLYALAQEAGYTGNDSLAQLTAWAGKSGQAGTKLSGVVSQMTVAMADANTDAQKLIGSLLQMANTAFQAAIEKTSGMQDAISAFAKQLVDAHGKVNGMVESTGTSLYNAMINAGMGTNQAKTQLDTWAKSMGISQKGIDQLNASLPKATAATSAYAQATPSATQSTNTFKGSIDQLLAKTNDTPGTMAKANAAIQAWMTKLAGGDESSTQAQQSLDALLKKYGVDTPAAIATANKAEDALHQKLVTLQTDAANARKAQNDLNSAINSFPTGQRALSLMVKANGTATVQAALKAASTPNGSISGTIKVLPGASGGGMASGGIVPGASPSVTQDTHTVNLKGGELIIPSQHAAKFGDMARKASIPGFASGGMVTDTENVGSLSQAVNSAGTESNDIGNAFTQAITQVANSVEQSAQAAAAGGSGPLGGATGSAMQNGAELFRYLLTNLFSGNKIAAAGAIASIYGESAWNPMAVGTGGRGLIGWTPEGTISNQAFQGGMRTQEPQIINFVRTSGDMGVISMMKSAKTVEQAAWDWGKGVERYGIPDVHPEGIALATSIMNSYSSGGSSTKAAQGAANALGKTSQKPHSGGGTLNEPIHGFGQYSGMSYSFAEHGPEAVVNQSQMAAMAGSGGGNSISQAQLNKMIEQNERIIQVGQQQVLATKAGNNAGNSGLMRGRYGA